MLTLDKRINPLSVPMAESHMVVGAAERCIHEA